MCPATTGHLNTILPLGKALQQRGHQVILFGLLDAEAKALAAGLDFQAIALDEFPLGSQREFMATLGALKGRQALTYTISQVCKKAKAFLDQAPDAIRQRGLDGLVVDQVSQEGGTIADHLGIPFVSLCSALVLNREITIPPYSTLWNYDPSVLGRLRNGIGYSIFSRLTQPITTLLNSYRQRWQLAPHRSPNDRYSPLAQISQQPAAFEFPRRQLPAHFHFTGPFHQSIGRDIPEFPWERLTGQPLIYASMGTIQNQLMPIFQTIAEACQTLEAQLVISLGGGHQSLGHAFAGNPLVVDYAPQLELLSKTTLTITHGGLNTTLECLAQGVPMVAIPIANDQPGVAARIRWSGVGEAIALKKLTAPRLRSILEKVLTSPTYKGNALRLQTSLHQSGGVDQAVAVIEKAIATGQPVLAPH
jgi:MGT family glycosyltransferase